MNAEVKEVLDAIKDIGNLKESARRLRTKIKTGIDDAQQTLDQVEQGIANPLGDAVAELKGFLVGLSNNPPKEGDS